jgi:trimeric autotransporter adhesin
MASTYSQYKIELVGTGEQAGTWGTTTNNNFGSDTPGTYQGFEQAIGGRADVTMSGTTTLSLTNSNAAQDARALYLNLSGTLSGAADLVVPALQKSYLVKNGTTGGFAVTIKVTGQTGVSIPNGKTVWVYNNGTDIVTAVDFIPEIATTTVDTTNDATINGLTVGEGAGSVSTNTAVGASALAANTTGASNTAVGSGALDANTTGVQNTAVGVGVLGGNVSGNNNTAVGYNALLVNTGNANTAIGHNSGLANTTGGDNTALGLQALKDNETGSSNTALGVQALLSNTTASFNTAVGRYALATNTTGSENTALGYSALYLNTTGANNTAVGRDALVNNTTGANNTAVGYQALDANTTGTENAAVGKSSLASVDGGVGNVALGNSSGTSITTGNNNVCVGRGAGLILTTGSENTLIGRSAGEFTGPTTGSRNVLIGLDARASAGGGSSQIVIVSDTTATGKGDNTGFIRPGTGGMYQGNNSSSWSTTSDQRLKKNIVDNTEGLDKINALRVRNFEYRTEEEITELDPACAINKSGVQLGVIAQEIQQVCSDCVKEESTGVLSVDSDNVFWHMVNAIKELSAKCDSLQAEINTLKGQ